MAMGWHRLGLRSCSRATPRGLLRGLPNTHRISLLVYRSMSQILLQHSDTHAAHLVSWNCWADWVKSQLMQVTNSTEVARPTSPGDLGALSDLEPDKY